MKNFFYLVLCLFLLLSGCENLSQESKDSSVQQNTSATQQTPSADNVDADKVPNEDTNQEIDKEPAQDTNEEANKEEVNQGTNPEDNNQGATENPSQGTNQENTDNQEVIFTEKPDNYTGEIWVDGVTKESGWVDVNKGKGLVPSEGNTCWMATSANVLMDYCRRKKLSTDLTKEDIYQKLYEKAGGDIASTYINGIPEFAIENNIHGIESPYRGMNRGTCLWETNYKLISTSLIKHLHKGAAGIKFVWKGGSGTGHALTLWGAEFKEGILTKIYVTDSDDNSEKIADYEVIYTNNEILVPKYISGQVTLSEVYIPF